MNRTRNYSHHDGIGLSLKIFWRFQMNFTTHIWGSSGAVGRNKFTEFMRESENREPFRTSLIYIYGIIIWTPLKVYFIWEQIWIRFVITHNLIFSLVHTYLYVKKNIFSDSINFLRQTHPRIFQNNGLSNEN